MYILFTVPMGHSDACRDDDMDRRLIVRLRLRLRAGRLQQDTIHRVDREL